MILGTYVIKITQLFKLVCCLFIEELFTLATISSYDSNVH